MNAGARPDRRLGDGDGGPYLAPELGLFIPVMSKK